MKEMKKGFVLIELIIAAAIVVTIAGSGLANYNQFNQREKLKAAALTVKTYLRKAQANALAGVKDEAACLLDPLDPLSPKQPLDGWCLDMNPDRRYLYGHCGGEPAVNPNAVDFSVEQFSLPDGVDLTFHPTSQQSILLFKPLAQGVDQASIICLTNTSFGRTYRYKITVTTSGEITDFGFVPNCP